MARYQPRHARSAPRGRRVLVLTAIILAGALTAGFMAGPASAATSRTFRIGSRGADVLAFERRLAGLHYDVGRVDGFYDNSTFHSVIAFQKVNGLARDGIAGPITKAKLAHQQARPPLPPGLLLRRLRRPWFLVGAGLPRQPRLRARDDRGDGPPLQRHARRPAGEGLPVAACHLRGEPEPAPPEPPSGTPAGSPAWASGRLGGIPGADRHAGVARAMTHYSRRSIGSRERVSRPAPSIATSGTTSSATATLSQGTAIGYGVGAGQTSA